MNTSPVGSDETTRRRVRFVNTSPNASLHSTSTPAEKGLVNDGRPPLRRRTSAASHIVDDPAAARLVADLEKRRQERLSSLVSASHAQQGREAGDESSASGESTALSARPQSAASVSTGTTILDALLSLAGQTREVTPHKDNPAPASLAGGTTPLEERGFRPGVNVSAESHGSADPAAALADTEVSIEHVSVLHSPSKATQQSAPFTPAPSPQHPLTSSALSSPSAPSSVTSGTTREDFPRKYPATLQPHGPAVWGDVSDTGAQLTALSRSTGAADRSQPREGAVTSVSSGTALLSTPTTTSIHVVGHPAASPPSLPVNTLILDSRNGSLQDVTSPAGAWRSQFAANAQRLLRETQQQVQELMYYKEAYEAALAAHEMEKQHIQSLETQLRKETNQREEETAAHDRAMSTLSQEALALSKDVGSLRVRVNELRDALDAVRRERDEAQSQKHEAQVKLESCTSASRLQRESAREEIQRASLEAQETITKMQLRIDSLNKEKAILIAEKENLHKLQLTWETRLSQERRRWRSKLLEAGARRDDHRGGARMDGDTEGLQSRDNEVSSLLDVSGIASDAIGPQHAGSRSVPSERLHPDVSHDSGRQRDTEDMYAELTQQEQDSLLESMGAAGITLQTENEKVLLRHIQYLTRELQVADHTLRQEREKAAAASSAESRARLSSNGDDVEKQRLCAEVERLLEDVASLQAEKDDLKAALEASRVHRETLESSRHDDTEASLSLSRQLRASRRRISELEATVRSQQMQLSQQERQFHETLMKETDRSEAATRGAFRREVQDCMARIVSEYASTCREASADVSPALVPAQELMSRIYSQEACSDDGSDSCADQLSTLASVVKLIMAESLQRSVMLRETDEGSHELREEIEAPSRRVDELQRELAAAQETISELHEQLAAANDRKQQAGAEWNRLVRLLTKQHQLLQNAAREFHPRLTKASGTKQAVVPSHDPSDVASPSSSLLTAGPQSEADSLSEGVLEQVQQSHQHLLQLLAHVRELKASAHHMKQKHKEAVREQESALVGERNRVKELEGRIASAMKEVKASEARRRDDNAALQEKVESRLSELLSQLEVAEKEVGDRKRTNQALERRLQAAERGLAQSEALLEQREAEWEDLRKEHIAFTEALRDVVQERDELLAERVGLTEATQRCERRAASDREDVLYLYALLTQWSRWTSLVMLQRDEVQLQKQWLRAGQRETEAQLAALKSLILEEAARERGAVPDGSDIPKLTDARPSPRPRMRGRNRFRSIVVALMALFHLRHTCLCRQQVLSMEGFASVSIVGSASVVLGADETTSAEGSTGRRSSTYGTSATREPSASVPRVVFFAEDATERALDEEDVQGETADRSAHWQGTTGFVPTVQEIPFLSMLSFPGTLQVTAERLRRHTVLPDTFLPPLHELLKSLRHLFKREHKGSLTSARRGTDSSVSGYQRRTANAYDLVEYMLHALYHRVLKTQSPNVESAPLSMWCSGSQYLTRRWRNRSLPRPSPVSFPTSLSTRPSDKEYSVQNRDLATELRHIFSTREGRLRATEARVQDLEKDMALITAQNIELGRALQAKTGGQESIARDLAALEDMVRSQPTSEDLQAMRQRLLSLGEELQHERMRRRAQEDQTAEYQANEISLRSVLQQLQNEIRALKIELGRRAAAEHNYLAALTATERQYASSVSGRLDVESSSLTALPTVRQQPVLSALLTEVTSGKQAAAATAGPLTGVGYAPSSVPHTSVSLDSRELNGFREPHQGLPHGLGQTSTGGTGIYEPQVVRQHRLRLQEAAAKQENSVPHAHRVPSTVSTNSEASANAPFGPAAGSRRTSPFLEGGDDTDGQDAFEAPPSSYLGSRRSTLPKKPSPSPPSDHEAQGRVDEAAGRSSSYSSTTRTSFAEKNTRHVRTTEHVPEHRVAHSRQSATSTSLSPPPRLQRTTAERPLRFESADSQAGMGSGRYVDPAGPGHSSEHTLPVSAVRAGASTTSQSFDDRYVSINPPSVAEDAVYRWSTAPDLYDGQHAQSSRAAQEQHDSHRFRRSDRNSVTFSGVDSRRSSTASDADMVKLKRGEAERMLEVLGDMESRLSHSGATSRSGSPQSHP